jgi:hypothetical protein
MITNDGKQVLSKYLLGQTPSYATHIAVGCGATPLDPNDSMPEDIEFKNRLDFEMIRVPISSKGFVEEDGVTKISFIAQLPTENRFEITEVGLWSAASNSLARGFDSRMIFDFQESWQAHDSAVDPIPLIENLGSSGTIEDGGRNIFLVDSGNSLLEEAERVARKEGPRFLNTSIFMRGDSSNIESDDFDISTASATTSLITYLCPNDLGAGERVTISGSSNELFNLFNVSVVSASSTQFSVASTLTSSASSVGGAAWRTGSWTPEEDPSGFVSRHIHLNNINLNTANNSPSDIFTLAFSLVDKDSVGNGNPEFAKVIIEFFRNESNQETGFAKAELYIPGSEFSNRYKAISFPISQLITSPDFTPSQIKLARIFCYVPVISEGDLVGSSDHYVALDGLRLDNVSTNNPLYKMVGYSSIVTPTGSPIIKYRNTNNYVEFRFGIGVT